MNWAARNDLRKDSKLWSGRSEPARPRRSVGWNGEDIHHWKPVFLYILIAFIKSLWILEIIHIKVWENWNLLSFLKFFPFSPFDWKIMFNLWVNYIKWNKIFEFPTSSLIISHLETISPIFRRQVLLFQLLHPLPQLPLLSNWLLKLLLQTPIFFLKIAVSLCLPFLLLDESNVLFTQTDFLHEPVNFEVLRLPFFLLIF